MAKKQNRASGDRSDPKQNRTLAYRRVAREFPNAKAEEIIRLVKERYGHELTPTFIYLAKSKEKRLRQRQTGDSAFAGDFALLSPKIDAMEAAIDPTMAAVRSARTLMKIAGSMERAIEFLRAVE